ncbi:MAG TPA: hypothetical protein VF131_21040 [Blastocatellia bacterium]|nr:hypothetical protein [Blastocatellia bacterium]
MRIASRFVIAMLLLLTFSQTASQKVRAQASQTNPQDQPYTVEYYYKARWGHADEFLRLFKKNHFPVLQKQIESGQILQVTGARPRYHATEDGRWDYRVTIVFKNLAAAHDSSGEEAIIKKLYPDQETFRKEEQRRFEILIAHWDVPLVAVALDR